MSEEAEIKKPAKKTAAKTTRKPAAKKAAPRKTAAKASTSKTAAAKTTAKKTAAKKSSPAKKTAAAKTASTTKRSTAQKKTATPPQQETPSPEAADTPQGTDAGVDDKANQQDGATGNAFDADEFRREFKQKDWAAYALRGAFMILFGFLAWIAISVNFLLSGLQFIMLILTGAPNEFLRKTIMVLGRSIVDVMQYLSFESDERPFPLGKDLPNTD